MTKNKLSDEKVLQYSIENEQIALGSLLIDKQNIYLFLKHATPDDFYVPLHSQLAENIKCILDKNGNLSEDNILNMSSNWSVIAPDKNEQELKEYIRSISSLAFTVLNVQEHYKLVAEYSDRRKMLRVAEELKANIQKTDLINLPSKDITANTVNKLLNLSERHSGEFFKTTKEIGMTFIKNLEDQINGKNTQSLISTGFESLNNIIYGFKPGTLNILAGRPGMGKTAFALQLASNAEKHFASSSKEDHRKVGIISLEMMSNELYTRLISMESQIAAWKFNKNAITSIEFPAVVDAWKKITAQNIIISDKSGLDINQLKAEIYIYAKKNNLGILFIDYLQLINASEKNNSSKTYQVAEITLALKNIAKELAIPVVALAQLSRQVESREDKRPMLSDLRDSGSIEQDADIVMFIYRDYYYRKKDQEALTIEEEAFLKKIKNQTEIIVAKHRAGSTGTSYLHFDYNTGAFYNLNNPVIISKQEQIKHSNNHKNSY